MYFGKNKLGAAVWQLATATHATPVTLRDVIRSALSAGVSAEQRFPDGRTYLAAFVQAANDTEEDIDLIRSMIDSGADPNKETARVTFPGHSSDRGTAMHLAVYQRPESVALVICQMLVSQGGDPNCLTTTNRTVLDVALDRLDRWIDEADSFAGRTNMPLAARLWWSSFTYFHLPTAVSLAVGILRIGGMPGLWTIAAAEELIMRAQDLSHDAECEREKCFRRAAKMRIGIEDCLCSAGESSIGMAEESR